MTCYDCAAKTFCIDACQPGSIMCLANKLRTGKTKADIMKSNRAAVFCCFCGKPLRTIGSEKFCNNTQCQNRYLQV